MTSTPLVTPLYDTHVSYGAKMIDFSGYMLPVWYSSVREEHSAVRTGSGVFDISHMGGDPVIWGQRRNASAPHHLFSNRQSTTGHHDLFNGTFPIRRDFGRHYDGTSIRQ